MNLTVGKAVSGIYTAASPTLPMFGLPVTVSALLAGATGLPAPTGTVTFAESGAVRGTVPVGSDGRGSLALPSLNAGSHSFSASYGGDTNYSSSTAPALDVFVSKAVTNTTLAANFGAPFVATVTVTQGAGVPTGTVQFVQGGTPIGTAPLVQQGSSFTATLPAGSQTGSIWANYQGDSNFNGSLAPAVTVLAGARLSIGSDPNPAAAGQAVTFRVQASANSGSGVPTGTVQLSEAGVQLGTAALAGGQATLTTTLPVGTHTITAAYSGDSLYPAATATYSQVVAKSVTTIGLTSSASTTVYGQLVTFGAQLAAPGGTVEFSDSGVAIGSAQAAGGVATLSVSSLSTGTHSITAAWSGDGNSAAAISSPLTHTVEKAQTTTALSLDGLTLHAGVAVAAPGAGTPSGTIALVDAATNAVLATAGLTGGLAAIPLPSIASSIVAVYSGDPNFMASSSRPLTPLVAVNAASGAAEGFAPDEIVTLYGSNLEGAGVTVTDSNGVQRRADVLFSAPSQLSFVMPAEAAVGRATVTGTGTNGSALSTETRIASVAPGLVAADGSGQGTPAGQIIRVHSDGTQDPPEKLALPIDLGPPGGTVYLVLFGTGFRHYAALPVCMAGGESIQIAFAGAQGSVQGLDQVNLILPQSLSGKTLDIKLIIDGVESNALTLVFR